MKRSVHLFIGGMEVEFKSSPDILYNFRIDDITSPAAVKSTYSKTVAIPSTRNNDKIFDSFFNNDYRTTGTNFDAAKKTEFSIYIDGELYETGYCQLERVRQNKHTYEYEVTLYGGLGEFFYNLSYKDSQAGDDESMKMSDLDYGTDLGFTINKETVSDAWENIGTGKWGIINFAAAYNGLPDDFDADKCLMNLTSGSEGGHPEGWYPRPGGKNRYVAPVITSVTSEDKTYETYGGYAVAELSREYTEAEMRDFRSYLQRPVLNVSKAIEAICEPANNGGYEVSLDEDWFNASNKYWKDLWVTMPMLSALEYVSKEDDTGVTVTIGAKQEGTLSGGDPGYYEDFLVNVGNNDSDKAFDLNVSVKLDLKGVSTSSEDTLVICAYSNQQNMYYPSAMLVQLVAYDAFGRPVAGSPVQYITTAYGARRSSDGRSSSSYFIDYSSWDYTQPYGNEYSSAAGTCFEHLDGNSYRWDETISMTAQNVPVGSTVKLLVTELYKSGSRPSGSNMVFHKVPGQQSFTAYTFEDFDVELIDYKVSFKTGEGIRTGVEFTQKQLLDTEYSPCDFLLSYAKIFGLYFLKDPLRKKITILTRKNFFERDSVSGINKYIDRSSVDVTPLAFDKKWYEWNLDSEGGEYADAYKKTYGKPYGNAKINVNYNFNRETNEVLDGNIFKGAVQVLERSAAFCYVGEDTVQKSWQFPGYNYLLYNRADSTDTYEVTVNPSSTIDAYKGFSDGYLYYDMFDRVQLHTEGNSPADGTNVLLLYNGRKSFQLGSVKIKYILSDDNSYMAILNDGRPCWLYSTTTGDSQGNDICIFLDDIPHFSRFYEAGGMINKSLDFGKPEEIYVPGRYYGEDSTIYNQFWSGYISDLYSKDSRILKTKMLIKGKPSVDWLRRFYVFDNAIWRMTDIEDYDISKDRMATVTFVRVQDTSNYSSEVVVPDTSISISLDSDRIALTGGTVSFTVTAEEGVDWYIQYSSGVTLSITSGTGTESGTITIPEYYGGRTLYFTAVSRNSSDTKYITQFEDIFVLERVGSEDIPMSGGTLLFKVLCTNSTWTAHTDYSGIVTAFEPSSGYPTTTGGTLVAATVDANEYPSRRMFSVYVENEDGQKAWLYAGQEGESHIRFIPPELINVAASGGTYNLYVEANAPWTTSNLHPEVCYPTVTEGTGNTYLQVVVAANPTYDTRANSILFFLSGDSATHSFVVTQQASEVTEIFTVERIDSGERIAASGGTIPVRVVCTNGSWAAYTDYGAIVTGFSPSSGGATSSAGTTFDAIIAASPDYAKRDFSFYVQNNTSGQKIYVYASQSGEAYIRFIPAQLTSVASTGGTYNLYIESNAPWTTSNPYPGIAYVTNTQGTGNTYTSIVVEPNPNITSRSTYILFYLEGDPNTYTYSISQQESVAFTLERTDGGGTISETGGTMSLKVVCTSGSWTARTDYGGIVTSFSPSSGGATGLEGTAFNATIAPNPYSSNRSFSLYVENSFGQKAYVYASQSGVAYIRFIPAQLTNVSWTGGTYNLYVEANAPWTAFNQDSSKSYVTDTQGTGNTYTQVVVTHNSTPDARLSYILFFVEGDSSTHSYVISQEAGQSNYFRFYDPVSGTTGSTTSITVTNEEQLVPVDFQTNAVSLAVTVTATVGSGDWIQEVTWDLSGIAISLAHNSGFPRNANISVTATYGDGVTETYTGTLRQRGPLGSID